MTKYTAYKLYNKTEKKWIRKKQRYNYSHHKFTEHFEDARIYTSVTFAKSSDVHVVNRHIYKGKGTR